MKTFRKSYGNKSYDLSYSVNDKEIVIKNNITGVTKAGDYISLQDGIDVVGANLRIMIDDKETFCDDGLIYENYDEPSVGDCDENDIEDFLDRIIRFDNGNKTENEIYHITEEWTNNPNT